MPIQKAVKTVKTDKKKLKILVLDKEDQKNIVHEIRCLTRMRTVVIKSRIMQEIRLQAIVAVSIGYNSNNEDEKERKEYFDRARNIINTVLGRTKTPVSSEDPEYKPGFMYSSVIKATYIGIDALVDEQMRYEEEMIRLVKMLPISKWAEKPNQKGFGLVSLAVVMGEVSNWDWMTTIAKLWRRFALLPHSWNGSCHMGCTWRKRAKEVGSLPKEEWVKYGYNPRLRSVMYVIATNLIKQNGEGPYRKRYNDAKERAKEVHPDWTPMHCHLHAMLMCSKLLLKNIWLEWNDYPVGGHADDPDKTV